MVVKLHVIVWVQYDTQASQVQSTADMNNSSPCHLGVQHMQSDTDKATKHLQFAFKRCLSTHYSHISTEVGDELVGH